MTSGSLTALQVLMLQAVAQPLPLPELQPNVNLWGLLAWAALNPAGIAVAVWMGRHADQKAKLGITAFAAAAAGIALLWLAAWFQFSIAVDTARAAAGVFVTALPISLFWAWLGRRTRAIG